jgi:hypothetical protein
MRHEKKKTLDIPRYTRTSLLILSFNTMLILYIRMIKSRRMRWVWNVARMGERRGVYMVLVGKPEGKTPLAGPRRRWEDNIKMDLQEMGWGIDWIGLAQDRDR